MIKLLLLSACLLSSAASANEWMQVGSAMRPSGLVGVDVRYKNGITQLAMPANTVNWDIVAFYRLR